MIDRNKIWDLKKNIELSYLKFKNHHEQLLNLLEDADYISDINSEEFYGILDEYKNDMEVFKEVFKLFERHDKQIKLLMRNDVGILKKKREDILTSIQSRMNEEKDEEDEEDLLPF